MEPFFLYVQTAELLEVFQTTPYPKKEDIMGLAVKLGRPVR
jgi:hypothetical protein